MGTTVMIGAVRTLRDRIAPTENGLTCGISILPGIAPVLDVAIAVAFAARLAAVAVAAVAAGTAVTPIVLVLSVVPLVLLVLLVLLVFVLLVLLVALHITVVVVVDDGVGGALGPND